MLPDSVADIIRSASTEFGTLAFGARAAPWKPISEFRSLPNEVAIYTLGLHLGVKYPKMVSKIVYVGSTAKIRERMRSYAKGGHNLRLDLLHRRFPGGLQCAYYLVPGLELQWRRAIEDAALQAANASLGCYPLCNMAPIDSKLAEACRGLVTISPCDDLPFPQLMDSLNCGSGELLSFPEGKQWKKADSIGYCGMRIDSMDSVSGASAVAPTSNTIEETKAEKQIERQREIEHLSWISQDEVAMWSIEKMRRVAEICGQLTRISLRGKTQVISFESQTPVIPCPDTWGEVALLKAREIAGTFYPASRTWLKVRHGKLLLGQAILEPTYYRAEDKSDLPQTKRRNSIWRNAGWLREVKAIHAELPTDFRPQEVSLPVLPRVDPNDAVSESHIKLLQVAREFDLNEAEYLRGLEIRDALERDRYRKASRILSDRIEAMYRAAIETLVRN